MPQTCRIDLHLRCRVRPGAREAFLAFLREAIPFYESPGGITIGLLQDHADELRFIECVHYDTEEIYLRDQQRVAADPVMKTYLARWRDFLAEPPVVEAYRVMSP